MPSETVADKINRLAAEKGLPDEDAILSAIYAGWSEEQILAADSGELLRLRPRQQREPAERVMPPATEPAIKYEPIRM
jgi:hypothetical protein